MSKTYILPLHRSASLFTVGGKGLNLAHLINEGFPVPPGFVLTTEAYLTFVRVHKLDAIIQAQMATLSPEDPASLQAAAMAIRGAFHAASLPEDIVAALHKAYADLGFPAVAVRSSATAEDLPGFSFAGLQDTYLNIVGEESLTRAVIDCWSSLWTARAIGYRARNDLDHNQVLLAVVVQTMILSESSGVLFTANPLTGKRDEIVIDATTGLGEALVSGLVEPDHYVVDATGLIVSKTIGTKSLAIYGRDGGGTITTHLKAVAQQQAISDTTILELAQLGRKVEAALGTPQDIEWANTDGRLYLLQARPITTLYPLPEGLPREPLHVLFSFGSVQGVLTPITPLGRDVISTLLIGIGTIFGYSIPLETQRVFWEAGERLWGDITGLLNNRAGHKLLLSAIRYVDPGASQILQTLIVQGELRPPGPVRIPTVWRVLRAFLPMIAQALHTMLKPDAEREYLSQQLETLLTDFAARLEQAKSFPEKLAQIRRTLSRVFAFQLIKTIPRFSVGMIMYNLLGHLANTLPENTIDTRRMMRGVPYNVTTEMDLMLWQTAQVIRDDPVARNHFWEHDAHTLTEQYQQGTLPATAQKAILEFMQRYGMRGLAEIDLGRPRWREAPHPIIQTLRSYLNITDSSMAPDAVYQQGRQIAEAEVEQLIAALHHTRGGWFKARLAKAAAYRMRSLLGLRELPKFTAIRLLGMVRQVLLTQGDYLAAASVISQPDDLFFLHWSELEILAGRQHRDWKTLLQARRRTFKQESNRRQIPRVLLSDGRAFYEGITPPEKHDDSAMYGAPVSPGVVKGKVHVVRDPRSAQLEPGEILVCPGTDPSWTPLFLTAGGLIMEVGGMMTHGAVVAREYGLPAVVGVHQATQKLHTGQLVHVDGQSGKITLLAHPARPSKTHQCKSNQEVNQ